MLPPLFRGGGSTLGRVRRQTAQLAGRTVPNSFTISSFWASLVFGTCQSSEAWSVDHFVGSTRGYCHTLPGVPLDMPSGFLESEALQFSLFLLAFPRRRLSSCISAYVPLSPGHPGRSLYMGLAFLSAASLSICIGGLGLLVAVLKSSSVVSGSRWVVGGPAGPPRPLDWSIALGARLSSFLLLAGAVRCLPPIGEYVL